MSKYVLEIELTNKTMKIELSSNKSIESLHNEFKKTFSNKWIKIDCKETIVINSDFVISYRIYKI